MDRRREVQDIHRRRKARKRKKLLKKILTAAVIAAALAAAAAVCITVVGRRSGGKNEPAATPAETAAPTAAPSSTPVPTAAPTPEPTAAPTPEPVSHRGTWEPIPEDVRAMMYGSSLPEGASVGFDDLAYLTIPHYDFDHNITEGHMVVNAALADEVLDIFADLFDIGYPIERMRLVDYYDADDYTSIEYNNTSAFNYRESTDGSGSLSKHALGCAIDINPQINPYVNSSGVGAHDNASEYWSRDVSSWSSAIAREAYIGADTEIYDIFVNKYGWEWGGSWSSYRDYQHFQKDM